MKAVSVRTTWLVSVVPSMRTGNMARGWRMCLNSLRASLASVSRRTHLKPPVVEPAQAPTAMMNSMTGSVNAGHSRKSKAMNPVVDWHDTTWKAASRRARSRG